MSENDESLQPAPAFTLHLYSFLLELQMQSLFIVGKRVALYARVTVVLNP
jgi:hypothetical protein